MERDAILAEVHSRACLFRSFRGSEPDRNAEQNRRTLRKAALWLVIMALASVPKPFWPIELLFLRTACTWTNYIVLFQLEFVGRTVSLVFHRLPYLAIWQKCRWGTKLRVRDTYESQIWKYKSKLPRYSECLRSKVLNSDYKKKKKKRRRRRKYKKRKRKWTGRLLAEA